MYLSRSRETKPSGPRQNCIFRINHSYEQMPGIMTGFICTHAAPGYYIGSDVPWCYLPVSYDTGDLFKALWLGQLHTNASDLTELKTPLKQEFQGKWKLGKDSIDVGICIVRCVVTGNKMGIIPTISLDERYTIHRMQILRVFVNNVIQQMK